MRIKVSGTACDGLRTTLKEAGFVVTEHFPAYHITLNSDLNLAYPTVDGVDCEFERRVVNFLAELTPSGRVLLQRAGGVQSDTAITVTVPARQVELRAAEIGIMRACLNHLDRKVPWYRRFWV